MAFTNFETKEINCKIIYFGPRAAGKTANLKALYSSTSTDARSGLIELEGEDGPTRFFDFLPISLGQVRDFHLKLHLFTLPMTSLYESVTSVILKGVDGFVFVADARVEAMADNVAALSDAHRLLIDEGSNVSDMPRVFQYNKTDLSDIIPVEILRAELNPGSLPDHKAIATQGVGTIETLQSMAKQVIKRLSY